MNLVWKIDRRSPLPLYAQIRQRLISEIYSWEDIERRFYSDDELSKRFSVSKMTVRQAVADLVKQGLLTRIRARGTFVAKKVFEEQLSSHLDIEAQYQAVGSPQQTHLIEYRWQLPTDTDLRDFGRLACNGRILVLSRLRAAEAVPVAIDRRRIPETAAGPVGFDEEAALGSIVFRLLTLSDPPVTADWTIEIRSAKAKDARHLCVNRGSSLLVRRMSYKRANGDVVLTGETLHRADIARYRLTLPLKLAEDSED